MTKKKKDTSTTNSYGKTKTGARLYKVVRVPKKTLIALMRR